MPVSYSIILTVEDAKEGETNVSPVFSGGRPFWNQSKIISVCGELANNFKMENSFRRVEMDCIETNENGDRNIFHHVELKNESFGKITKSDLDKLVDQINKENKNA